MYYMTSINTLGESFTAATYMPLDIGCNVKKYFCRYGAFENENSKRLEARKWIWSISEPRHEKTCFMLWANNKDADQSAHPPTLSLLK